MKGVNRILILALTLAFLGCGESSQYLLLFEEKETGLQGYKYPNGEIVIPAGKYPICFTDTLWTFAIVAYPGVGIAAIDRNDSLLFQVFSIDNGPDEISEGLFRIVRDGKIGYANEAGVQVIDPQFSCALPFQNGKAKVAIACESIPQGEHQKWVSNSWFYIDTNGNTIGEHQEDTK